MVRLFTAIAGFGLVNAPSQYSLQQTRPAPMIGVYTPSSTASALVAVSGPPPPQSCGMVMSPVEAVELSV